MGNLLFIFTILICFFIFLLTIYIIVRLVSYGILKTKEGFETKNISKNISLKEKNHV